MYYPYMDIITKYIPKEYLALKINYLRDMLSSLPAVRISKRKRYGVIEQRCICENHNYSINSKNGKRLYEIAVQRKGLELLLSKYENEWRCAFQGTIPDDIIPKNIIRTINPNNPNISSGMDSEFFYSLKNDANPNFREHKKFPFNGVLYRSKAEAEIARFYTEQGIPFKYEPEIHLDGMAKPYHPDFVLLIKEINCCKIHEHLGIMSSSDYIRDNKIKLTNYLNAGLLPGYDIFFTYQIEDMLFSTKSIMPILNTVIYNSLISSL